MRRFKYSPFGGLVFNQAWEDPTIDRKALNVMADEDTVLSITSGGCSALNLLCLRPRRVIAVDANPPQSYLLELKLAAIRVLDHEDFWKLFGSSECGFGATVYKGTLRPHLPLVARSYWDRHVRFLERGLVTQGKLGFFLAWLRRYLHLSLGESRLRRFFETVTLEEQRELYFREIHPRLWRGPLLRVLCSPRVLTLAGMPRMQFDLVQQQGGIEDYIRDRVTYVLTEIPARDNYFLAIAALGSYLDRHTAPPYLLERHFSTLKEMADRLENVTAPLEQYLRSLPDQSIDKFNLMDIFDWMDQPSRQASLREITRTGVSGGRLIYRSTCRSLPIPSDYDRFLASDPELGLQLFKGDRALTYGSFYVYRIRARSRAQRS